MAALRIVTLRPVSCMHPFSFAAKPFPSLVALVSVVARASARAANAFVCVALVCASAPSPASASSSAAAAPTAIVVVYPSEGQEIGAFPKSFAIGSAPPGSVVTVNGVRAYTAPDGAWNAYVPLHPGRFVFHVRASRGGWSSEADRTVTVDDGTLAPFPTATTIVQPGESIRLAVSAPEGATVTADGPGFSDVALAPDASAGTRAFVASVRVAAQSAGPAHVVYHVSTANGRSDVASAGTLAVAARPVLYVADAIAEFTGRGAGYRPYAMLSVTPEADTDIMEPLGTRFAVTGRFGDLVRVAMPGWSSQYLERISLRAEPGTTTLPSASIASVQRTEGPRSTTIVVHMDGGRPPFRILEGGHASGRIEFFGAVRRDVDYLHAGTAGATGSVSSPATIAFSLPQHAFWGYTSRWSGDDLVLTFRKPPAFLPPPHSALAGLRIVIDPGHSPETGAIGPLGTVERSINLDVGLRLAARLRSLGAVVMLTRSTSKPVDLYDRPAIAEKLDADVLISDHENAPPDGIDPSREHGFSVYYYQPFSFALAQAIHQAYRDEIDIPDEGLHSGDLVLVRTSAQPAVLTESAFITWPWEEMLLREPSFREKLAKAMADGMERWAERMRAVESPK